MMEQTKKCSKCGEIKFLSNFSRNKNKKDGFCSDCKTCNSIRGNRWATQNKIRNLAKAINGVKKCSRCLKTLDVAAFGQQRRTSDGLNTYCLQCARSISLKRAYTKPKDIAWNQLRNGAKKRGLSVDLDRNWFESLLEMPCYYCGAEWDNNPYSYFLDRIDNSKGYSWNNVIQCCTDCNKLKRHNLSISETKAAVAAIKAIREAKNEPEVFNLTEWLFARGEKPINQIRKFN